MANCYFAEPHGMKHCYIPFFMLLISNALLVLARHNPVQYRLWRLLSVVRSCALTSAVPERGSSYRGAIRWPSGALVTEVEFKCATYFAVCAFS
jgi:hypothetical protein